MQISKMTKPHFTVAKHITEVVKTTQIGLFLWHTQESALKYLVFDFFARQLTLVNMLIESNCARFSNISLALALALALILSLALALILAPALASAPAQALAQAPSQMRLYIGLLQSKEG